ncbi:MAG: arginyltransferase [Gammaproteobacteria bacterium]
MGHRHTNLQQLAFFASRPHPCPYLPEREATTLFADPDARLDNRIYGRLSEFGFRRSGQLVYRPACPDCSACIPVRIAAGDFVGRRIDRRTWRRNEDLTVTAAAPIYREEHFLLYRKYLQTRHPGGTMDTDDPGQYLEFLTCSWSDTVFYEFRIQQRLLAIAVTDRLPGALSAVYTFFDPRETARGLGSYAILWQIAEARRQGLSWVYLGYWIEECRKMSYKGNIRPLQIFRDGHWIDL